jgi:hypothetical protein
MGVRYETFEVYTLPEISFLAVLIAGDRRHSTQRLVSGRISQLQATALASSYQPQAVGYRPDFVYYSSHSCRTSARYGLRSIE